MKVKYVQGGLNHFIIGKEYEVYAICYSLFDGAPRYLLNACDDDEDVYYYSANHFEVTDSLKPPFWSISPKDPYYEGPEELGPDYYEALVDGESEVVDRFKRIREIITDSESFEYVESLDALKKEYPEDYYVIVNERFRDKSSLIDNLNAEIGNKFTEKTWDGLSEALESFAWITDRTIRIVHVGIPALEEKDLFTYFSILRDACKEWKSPRGREQAGYLNIDVHICFLKEFRTNLEDIFYKYYR